MEHHEGQHRQCFEAKFIERWREGNEREPCMLGRLCIGWCLFFLLSFGDGDDELEMYL